MIKCQDFDVQPESTFEIVLDKGYSSSIALETDNSYTGDMDGWTDPSYAYQADVINNYKKITMSGNLC